MWMLSDTAISYGTLFMAFIMCLSRMPVAVPYPSFSNGDTFQRTPIILVPGYGGNQIQAKINKQTVPHVLCDKKSSDYFLLWVSLTSLTPLTIDCFIDNMLLDYNSQQGKSQARAGIDIRVPGWGDTDTMEYLNTLRVKRTTYYFYLVDSLVKQRGYTRGKDIRGAPFDFRKSALENDDFVTNLKTLIEETYEANNQTSVTLLGHSLGGVYTHHFLVQQSAAWKAKYIDSFISVAAPYGGAVSSLLAEASGDNLQIPTLKPIWVRELQRSFTTTASLIPKEGLWTVDDVLISTPQRNYSVNDLEALFRDLNFTDGYHMYNGLSSRLTDVSTPPGVRTLCILAQGFPTPERLDYLANQFPDSVPKIIYGEGDGTVNWRSSKICSDWTGKQPQTVTTKIFDGVSSHLDIIRDPLFLNYVLDVVDKSKEFKWV